jgi:hypothetical protein
MHLKSKQDIFFQMLSIYDRKLILPVDFYVLSNNVESTKMQWQQDYLLLLLIVHMRRLRSVKARERKKEKWVCRMLVSPDDIAVICRFPYTHIRKTFSFFSPRIL